MFGVVVAVMLGYAEAIYHDGSTLAGQTASYNAYKAHSVILQSGHHTLLSMSRKFPQLH